MKWPKFTKEGFRKVKLPQDLYVEIFGHYSQGFNPNQVTEEFYIEHLHVFSLQSLINLNYSCGLALLNYSSILEPSGKFTVWSIAMKL